MHCFAFRCRQSKIYFKFNPITSDCCIKCRPLMLFTMPCIVKSVLPVSLPNLLNACQNSSYALSLSLLVLTVKSMLNQNCLCVGPTSATLCPHANILAYVDVRTFLVMFWHQTSLVQLALVTAAATAKYGWRKCSTSIGWNNFCNLHFKNHYGV